MYNIVHLQFLEYQHLLSAIIFPLRHFYFFFLNPNHSRIHAHYVGTPEGVGPVRAGQKITAGITGIIDVHFDIQKRQKASSS